jgi:hypothetical protein
MERTVAIATALVVLALAGCGSAVTTTPLGAARPKTRRYTETGQGAEITRGGSPYEAVFRAVGALNGTCAGIERGAVSGTTFPLTEAATTTTYCANGVTTAKSTAKIAKPNASGISTVTGSGTCTGGSGIHTQEKCTYKFTGSENVETHHYKVTLTGTDTR